MNRFRVMDDSDDERVRHTPRRLVIDDPSSSSSSSSSVDVSGYTTAQEDLEGVEDDDDVNIRLGALTLSSPAVVASSASASLVGSGCINNLLECSIRTTTKDTDMNELVEGEDCDESLPAVPRVVRTDNRHSVSSLEQDLNDTSTFMVDTPNHQAYVGNGGNAETFVEFSLNQDDSTSTVMHGKSEASTSESVSTPGGNSDQHGASTVITEETSRPAIGLDDGNSEALVDFSLERDDVMRGSEAGPCDDLIQNGTSNVATETLSHEVDLDDSDPNAFLEFAPAKVHSVTALRQIGTPRDESTMADNSKALVDLTLKGESDKNVNDWRIAVQEDRVDVDRCTLLDDSSDALLVDTSIFDDASAMSQEQVGHPNSFRNTNPDYELVDTSSDEDDDDDDDFRPEGIKVWKKSSLGYDSDELSDSSMEQDDTRTAVQEGRNIKTSTRRVPLLHVEPEDSEDLTDESLEQKETQGTNVSFNDDYEDSAWAFDDQTNEVFLSDEKSEPPEASWPNFRIPLKLYKELYCHQKSGVQWMAGLHSMRIGGILGDDMGMGKTYQTLTLIGGLMRARTIRNALVVAPLSVLQSWEKEARVVIKKTCVSRITITVLSSDMQKHRRQTLLQNAMSCRAPYLIITTYGLIQSSPDDFISDRHGCRWDYVALDEGHKIKNQATQVHKACERICRDPQTRRIMLTGTPIQNNLKELWALFNWAASGRLLGTHAKFVNVYARPIEEGRNKNASASTIKTAEMANNEMQRILRPHFLQRMKADFMADELPEKTELVVWTHLSPKQRRMYETYVQGEKVADVLRGEVKSPLEAITWLKKLCGHPVLVESRQYDRATVVDCRKKEDLLRESAKLQVLVALVGRLRQSGHRTLIFSQSTRALDIMERALRGFRFSRIDGNTKGKDRQRLVESFNDETKPIDAMLLSTKAAGLGLTLTGASRAIIYDPSWNPSEDLQAIDRCYRIGQRKEVTVYRLIAAGTVEEKMYEQQVHKDGIRRAVTTTSGNNTERYFDKKDLKRLFELAPEGKCEVLDKIQATKHHGPTISSGNTFLKSHPGVVGVSCHDDIYLTTHSNLANSDDITTPFGGASANKPPLVLGRAQKVLARRKIDFSHAGDGMKENMATTKKSGASARSISKGAIDVDAAAEPVLAFSEAEIKVTIDEADSLREQGNEVGATSSLLDLVEREVLSGQQKLLVHQRLAELGRSLGWLYNETTP